MTNILQYSWWLAKKRHGTHCQKFGPVYLILASVPCVLTDQICLVVIDSFKIKDFMWVKGTHWFPNTGVGIFIMLLNYVGFALMIAGVIMVTGLHTKIRNKWRKMRGNRGSTERTAQSQVSLSTEAPSECANGS